MQGGGGDVAAWGQGAWFGSNGAAEQKGVHSLERYNQLLAQLPGGSALSSVESTAQPSPQPGACAGCACACMHWKSSAASSANSVSEGCQACSRGEPVLR